MKTNTIFFLILAFLSGWLLADAKNKTASLRLELQSDELWKNNPDKAIGMLRELVKSDAENGFPILFKRFDGWSSSQKEGPLVLLRPGRVRGEDYTLVPLVRELNEETTLKLIRRLTIADEGLKPLQRLCLCTALQQAAGSQEAFMLRLKKAIDTYKLRTDDLDRLKHNLNLNVELPPKNSPPGPTNETIP